MDWINCKSPIDSPSFSGNISIGAGSAVGTLDVFSDSSASSPSLTAISRVVTSNSAASIGMYVEQQRYNRDVLVLRQIQTGAPANLLTATSADGGIFVVKGNGFVGLGTSAPGAALDLLSDPSASAPGASGLFRAVTSNNATQIAAYIEQQRYNQDVLVLRQIQTSAPADLINATSADGGVFVVTDAGNVGVGTSSPMYTLHVNGSVAGASAYNNLSDARLKKNVRRISSALSIIDRIQGVQFDWRSPADRKVGRTFNLPMDVPQVGFIAQDLSRVLPEAVTVASGPEAIMSVQESKVVPVLVEAVKELKAANENQVAKIDRLTSQLVAQVALSSRYAADLRKVEVRLDLLQAKSGIRTAVN
jgi:hypothetical protein